MRILWDHDRNHWAPEAKPEGVCRVMCLGDSMIYGSGVNPEETLPAYLERGLNRAAWGADVEVLNFGTSGESVYDEWHRFVHSAHRYAPDLLLLLICGNDAELFSVSALTSKGQDISYAQHTANCWAENGVHFPHFERALADVGTQTRALGVPVIVGFYEIHDSEIRADVVGKISGACGRHGLGFVDLSQDFVGPSSSNQINALKVSEADGHPSDEAHRIAAMRLARAVLASGHIDKGLGLPEPALFDGLVDTHAARLAIGYRADYVSWRHAQLIELKRSSRARLKLKAVDKLPEVEYRARLDAAVALGDLCRRAPGWAGEAAALQDKAEVFYELKASIYERVKLVSRAIFVLGNCFERPELPLVSFIQGDPTHFDVAAMRDIPPAVDEIRAAIQARRAALSSDREALAEPTLEALAGDVRYALREAATPLLAAWAEVEAAATTVLNLITYLVELLERHQASLDPAAGKALAGIADGMRALFNDTSAWAKVLSLGVAPPVAGETPYVTVEVTISTEAPKPMCLWVQVRPHAPAGAIVSDMRWLVRDGLAHIHRLEVPSFGLGEVYLTLSPPQPAAIASVRVFNGDGAGVAPSPLTAVGQTGAAWKTPIATVAPETRP